MDLYVFATPYRITWDYYFTAREHTLTFESWEEPAELEYVSSCPFHYRDLFNNNVIEYTIILHSCFLGKTTWNLSVSNACGNARDFCFFS